MRYLHSKGFIYRNLKPSNILLAANGQVKVSDFCYSFTSSHSLSQERLSEHLAYQAPEVIQSEDYSVSSDIWSLGCVLYILMTKKNPFHGTNANEMKEQLQKFQIPPFDGLFSSDLRELLLDLLRTNQTLRISSAKIFQTPLIRKEIERKSQPNRPAQTVGVQEKLSFPITNDGILHYFCQLSNQDLINVLRLIF